MDGCVRSSWQLGVGGGEEYVVDGEGVISNTISHGPFLSGLAGPVKTC